MSDQIISAWEPDPREMEKMIDDLRSKIADLKSQRDVYKTIAEEAMKTVETQRKELELYRDPRAAYPTKSKEEYEKEPFCPACGKWGHTSGECPQITKEKI